MVNPVPTAARFLMLVAIFANVTGATATASPDTAAGPSGGAHEANPVLRIARSFADGGAYNEKWAGSGTPEEVRHGDARILAKGEGGTYCSGFTFAVAMRAAAGAKLLEGKSVDEVKRFQKQWYGATDEPDARERQCAAAVERLGVGRAVTHDEARPGDFAQVWRSNESGHSVVFLGWAEDADGKRVGLRYRSSQKGTDGIGDRTEYFSDAEGKDGKVLRERTYFARLNVK